MLEQCLQVHVCCCAGLVSITLLAKPIFGAPHMHLQPPTKSHFIGDLSPQGNPLHYLSSIRSLHHWYCNHCRTDREGCADRPPLVINTHGWIKVAGPCYYMCCAVLCCAVLCCAASAVWACASQTCQPSPVDNVQLVCIASVPLQVWNISGTCQHSFCTSPAWQVYNNDTGVGV